VTFSLPPFFRFADDHVRRKYWDAAFFAVFSKLFTFSVVIALLALSEFQATKRKRPVALGQVQSRPLRRKNGFRQREPSVF
jgi:hypothetical protein